MYGIVHGKASLDTYFHSPGTGNNLWDLSSAGSARLFIDISCKLEIFNTKIIVYVPFILGGIVIYYETGIYGMLYGLITTIWTSIEKMCSINYHERNANDTWPQLTVDIHGILNRSNVCAYIFCELLSANANV